MPDAIFYGLRFFDAASPRVARPLLPRYAAAAMPCAAPCHTSPMIEMRYAAAAFFMPRTLLIRYEMRYAAAPLSQVSYS